MSQQERVFRGAVRRNGAAIISTVTNGSMHTLPIAGTPPPYQEMWWFTDTASLVGVPADSTGTVKGTLVQPGDPADILLITGGGQQTIIGAREPLCARMSIASKDGKNLGRIEAVSAGGLADLTLDLVPSGSGSPRYGLSSFAGQTHDLTVVNTAFDDIGGRSHNVLMDDSSFALGPPMGTDGTPAGGSGVVIDLDPKYAMIDVSYSSDSGNSQDILHITADNNSANATLEWMFLSNEAKRTALAKTSGTATSGTDVPIFQHQAANMYGRVILAQMHNGWWQGWVRAYSSSDFFAEGVIVVKSNTPTDITRVILYGDRNATNNHFVHARRAYLK